MFDKLEGNEIVYLLMFFLKKQALVCQLLNKTPGSKVLKRDHQLEKDKVMIIQVLVEEAS